MFEETASTLFCSDLIGQGCNVEALTEGDIVGRSLEYNEQSEGPMSGAVPFTDETIPILESLANLDPKTLACMHGSSFAGDCGEALLGFRHGSRTHQRQDRTLKIDGQEDHEN